MEKASYCRRARVAARLARAHASSITTGVIPVAIRGVGFEYIDFREYVPGDDIRFIDWRLSARSVDPSGSMRLMVREFMVERHVNTVLAIDMSSSMDYGDKYEAALYAAFIALAAAHVYEDLVDLGILIRNELVVKRALKPIDAEKTLIHTLCSTKPGGGGGLGRFAELVWRLPKRRSMLVITDYAHYLHEYRELLDKTRAAGIRVGLVLVTTLYETRPPAKAGRHMVVDPETGRGVMADLAGFYRAVAVHMGSVDAVLRKAAAPSLRVTGLRDAGKKMLRIAMIYGRVRGS